MKILKKMQYYILFVMIGASALSSCQKEDVGLEELNKESSENNSRLKSGNYGLVEVGDRTEGGIVAHTGFGPGFVVGIRDLGLAQWHPNRQVIFCSAEMNNEIGYGYYFTEKLVTVAGNGTYAAKKCWDYSTGVYDDWYLPNKAELEKIWHNRAEIGDFDIARYWSSSEVEGDVWPAYSVNFGVPNQVGTAKSDKADYYQVRPIKDLEIPFRQSPVFSSLGKQYPSKTSIHITGGVNGPNQVNDYAVIERGICIGQEPNPTDEKVFGTGVGYILKTINNLSPGTKYYVRFYAKAYNLDCIYYGEETSFTTMPFEITTGIPYKSPYGTALYFQMTFDQLGTMEINEYGFCIGTTPNPTIEELRISSSYSPSSNSTSASILRPITPDTPYYVRAYMIDANDNVIYANNDVYMMYSNGDVVLL